MTSRIFETFELASEIEVLKQFQTMTQWNLAAKNEKGQSPLHLAVMKNYLAVAAFLLGKGYSVNQKDHTQLSPFIAAAANGFGPMFELLTQFQPQVNQVNRFGGTALHPSAEKGFIHVVQKALSAGVPADEKNRLGWTPLLEAVILGDEGYLYRDTIVELLSYQADPQETDDFGYHAIDYAKQLNHLEIADLLINGPAEDELQAIRQAIKKGQITWAIGKLAEKKETPEVLYYLGVSFERLNEDDIAAYYYQEGFKKEPQFAYYLANLAKKQKKYDQVESYFLKGSQQAHNPTFYEYHLSNFLREVGKHEAAIAVMDQLLAKEKSRVDYLFHKANSLQSLNRYEEAVLVLDQAAKIQPNNPLYAEQRDRVQTMKITKEA